MTKPFLKALFIKTLQLKALSRNGFVTKPFHKETLCDKAPSQSHLYIPTNPMGILYEQNYNAQAENVREDFIPENLPTVQHVQINFGLNTDH